MCGLELLAFVAIAQMFSKPSESYADEKARAADKLAAWKLAQKASDDERAFQMRPKIRYTIGLHSPRRSSP